MNLFAHRWLNRVHRGVLKLTRGHLGWTIGAMPVVQLTTVGRTTVARSGDADGSRARRRPLRAGRIARR